MSNRKTLPMDMLGNLSPLARATMLRLLSVAGASGMNLPREMLDEIESISIEGADREWQVRRMNQILDHWAPSH
jgi:hypothetical protein